MERTATPLHPLFADWGAEFLFEEGVERPLRLAGAGPEYQAARTAAALADGGDRAWLELRGGDAEDFLQRVLSSDVARLKPGDSQWSGMLDGKGHWVSDLLVFRLPGDTPAFGLDLPAVRRDVLLARLDMLHFGEDLAWTSPDHARLLVLGPKAESLLAEQGIPAPTRDLHETSRGLLLRRPDRGETCLELLGDPQQVQEVAAALKSAGAEPCGLVALDILRVEAFEPRWGDDFGEEDTLPNCNEWRRASLTKGCYAGQEVVAKVHTYGEAPRQLCRLRFDGDPLPLRGAELYADDERAVGRVRSWVWSPREERGLGLAMLRRKVAKSGTRLEARIGNDVAQATVEVPDKVLGG